MFDTRIIRRLAYDGNYQRAIELIVDIIDGKKNYFEVKEDLERRKKATQKTKDYAALETKFKALEQECTTLSWFAAFQENEANKYKQTLQEIKKIVEQADFDCILKIGLIKNIITKAESEG